MQYWFGKDWLFRRSKHPINQLWWRTDWLSTYELVSLGAHISQLAKRDDAQPFIKHRVSRVKSSSDENRTGMLWELFAASHLDYAEQRVEFVPETNPGFDFKLRISDGSAIRMSCKVLNPSNGERSFHNFCDQLWNGLPEKLIPDDPIRFWMTHLDQPIQGTEQAATILEHLPIIQRDWPRRPNLFTRFQDWTIGIEPLEPHPRLIYADGYPSTRLVVLARRSADEQLRFESKLKGAFKNLRDHCHQTSQEETNGVFMKLPPAVHVLEAIEYTENLLKSAPHIGIVILYRSHIHEDRESKQIQAALGHEIHVVFNPNAKHPIVHTPELMYRIPIGILKAAPLMYRVGSAEISAKDTHVFHRGAQYYDVLPDVTIEYERFASESVYAVLSGTLPQQHMLLSEAAAGLPILL